MYVGKRIFKYSASFSRVSPCLLDVYPVMLQYFRLLYNTFAQKNPKL
jgi:hypothetical protein